MSESTKSNQPLNTFVYLDHDRLSFCDNVTGASLVFPYPAGSIRDLEIKNFDLLSAHLRAFLVEKHLAPTHLVYIFSPRLYFETNLTRLSEEQRQAQSQKFLETIPFASVISKPFHLGNEYKLVAINGDFFEAFHMIFSQSGFQVIAAAPLFIFGNIDPQQEINADFCRIVTKKTDFILENSFIASPTDSQSLAVRQRHFLNKHNLIFALFSLLAVGVAIGTAFFTLRRPASVQKYSPPVVVRTVVTLAPTPLPSPILVATDSSQLTVSLQVTTSTRTQGTRLASQLADLGLTQVTSSTIPATTSASTVIYSVRVPSKLRLEIFDLLSDLALSPDIRESTTAATDITISF